MHLLENELERKLLLTNFWFFSLFTSEENQFEVAPFNSRSKDSDKQFLNYTVYLACLYTFDYVNVIFKYKRSYKFIWIRTFQKAGNIIRQPKATQKTKLFTEVLCHCGDYLVVGPCYKYSIYII